MDDMNAWPDVGYIIDMKLRKICYYHYGTINEECFSYIIYKSRVLTLAKY